MREIGPAVGTPRPVGKPGFSEGSIVIDREEACLATAPNGPASSQVTFVEFANPTAVVEL
jgi:PE-PPE domain